MEYHISLDSAQQMGNSTVIVARTTSKVYAKAAQREEDPQQRKADQYTKYNRTIGRAG